MTVNRLYSGLLAFGCAAILCFHGGLAHARASWAELSPKQQEFLSPLKNEWNSMTPSQQERWLKVGRKYETEPAERQSIMRERIGTWSELSPREKAAVRENYKALKEKRRGEKNSSWNSYQSLDPKQRDEFKDKVNKPSAN